MGAKILSNNYDQILQMRIGDKDGPDNFKFKKLNNLTVNPNPTKDHYMKILSTSNTECVNILKKNGS